MPETAKMEGAPCMLCDNGRWVTTHLYVGIVPYGALIDGSFGDSVKATHVGVRLPEEHLRHYRSHGLTRHYLPALAGDTTALEATLRRLKNPSRDGSVRTPVGVIAAENVEASIAEHEKTIELRHGYGLTSMHCRGHELADVVKLIQGYPLPVELRWNPGPMVAPLLTTGSPDGKKHQGWRGVVAWSPSEVEPALRALLEVK